MTQLKSPNLVNDIIAGIVVALVSIPISMGYAQIAGLPPVYGLYGSLLPIFVFAFLTSSPQFVIGVDAMPAAMVGGALAELGIAAGSEQAMALVPVSTLFTFVWFLIFYLVKAGRVVKYISTPVMSGFISGIGLTIILMQVPKLFGGNAGTGELFLLLYHIAAELSSFHLPSALLGIGTIAVILISKKLAPKFPMSIVMMAGGAIATAMFHIDQYGIKLLPEVPSGLPALSFPNITALSVAQLPDLIFLSLTISLVIMAQTLLASNNYALKYNYQINNNRELIAYAGMNLTGSIVGCCPINGSVSRTGMADQYECKSQVMSLTAAAVMLLVLLFGTGFLCYLPVPVLTGIVITALMGILETKTAKKLWKASKDEFFIFLMAFLGVLIFGTIYGVLIGMVLSFGAVIIRAVVPPKAFLGMIPGHDGLYNLQRNQNAHPISHTIIYRFSGNLFFANIETFQQDLEAAIQEDTRQVIVDARAIANIDITAAERLVHLNRNLRNRGIRFYLTEHVDAVNDQLRAFGAGELIESGAVRRTWSLALRDAGLEKPYPLEGAEVQTEVPFVEASERLAELAWAFGSEADAKLRQLTEEVAHNLVEMAQLDDASLVLAESKTTWGRIGLFDEQQLLDQLELYFIELAHSGRYSDDSAEDIEAKIEQRRLVVEEKLRQINPEAFELLHQHRNEISETLRLRYPEAHARLEALRKEASHPEHHEDCERP